MKTKFDKAYDDIMLECILQESMFSTALDIIDKLEWAFRSGIRKVKNTFYPKEKLTYEEAARKFIDEMNLLASESEEATVVMRDTLKQDKIESLVNSLNKTIKVFRQHFNLQDETQVEHSYPDDARRKKIISSIMLSPKTTIADKIALLWIMLSGKPLVFN